MIATFVITYGPTLLGLIFAGIAFAFHHFFSRQTWVAAFLVRIGVEAKAVVLEVEQVYVDRITAAREDGVLTPEEQGAAFAAALTTLKHNLGEKGLARLERILGFGGADIDRLLTTHVNAAVKVLSLTQTNELPVGRADITWPGGK